MEKKSASSAVKFLSFLNIAAVLWASCVPAWAEASLWQERRRAVEKIGRARNPLQESAIPSALSRPGQNNALHIPETLGTVSDSWLPDASPSLKIIHIQDAHGHYSAQKNASRILETIAETDPSPLVMVEGASAASDPDFLSLFPEPSVRKSYAEFLLREGIVGGEEFLAIAKGPGYLRLEGVEDPALYAANGESRRLLDPHREEILALLDSYSSRVKALEDHFCGQSLRRVEERAGDYSAEKISAKEYFDYLSGLFPDFDRASFPNLALFEKAVRSERSKTPEQVSANVREILKSLADSPLKELSGIVRASVLYRTGRMDPLEYYSMLLSTAKSQSLSCAELEAYVGSLSDRESIDFSVLAEELERLEDLAYAVSAGSAEEKTLSRISRLLRTQEKFWSQKLSPSKHADYGLLPKVSWVEMEEAVQNLERIHGRESAVPETALRAESLNRKISFAKAHDLQEAYYALAFQRDFKIAENAVRRAMESSVSQAVLIAGGFHTPGILKYFREHHVAYEVVRPSLESSEPLSDGVSVSPSPASDSELEYKEALEQRLKDAEKGSGASIKLALDILGKRVRFSVPSKTSGGIAVYGEYCGDRSNKYFRLDFTDERISPSVSVAQTQSAALPVFDTYRQAALMSAERSQIWPTLISGLLGQNIARKFMGRPVLKSIVPVDASEGFPLAESDKTGVWSGVKSGMGKVMRWAPIAAALWIMSAGSAEAHYLVEEGGKAAFKVEPWSGANPAQNTFSGIVRDAASYLGRSDVDALYREILKLNPFIRNPEIVQPGWLVRLPQDAPIVRDLGIVPASFQSPLPVAQSADWVQRAADPWGLPDASSFLSDMFHSFTSLWSSNQLLIGIVIGSAGTVAAIYALKLAVRHLRPHASRLAKWSSEKAESARIAVKDFKTDYSIAFMLKWMAVLSAMSVLEEIFFRHYAPQAFSSAIKPALSYLETFMGLTGPAVESAANIFSVLAVSGLGFAFYHWALEKFWDKKLPLLKSGGGYKLKFAFWTVSGLAFSLLYQTAAPLALWTGQEVSMNIGAHISWNLLAFLKGWWLLCGNVGMIWLRDPGSREALSAAEKSLLVRLGVVTSARGEQAAGSALITSDSASVEKLVNFKRMSLPHALHRAFSRRMSVLARRGKNIVQSVGVILQHYRFGTSSAPSKLETHPHQWMKSRMARVWTMAGGRYVSQMRPLATVITHNGDLDEWKGWHSWNSWGKGIDVSVVGPWLERVLHTPNSTKGDSPKIAGLMDLLITKGMWDASVRYAYQFAAAGGIDDASGGQSLAGAVAEFDRAMKGLGAEPSEKDRLRLKKKIIDSLPNTAPSPAQIKAWADIFEKAFVDLSEDGIMENGTWEILDRILISELKSDPAAGRWSEDVMENFVMSATRAFRENDLFNAVKIFQSKAVGTFGLAVGSTLENDRVVVMGWKQPMAVAFDPENRRTVYASEPIALNVLLEDSSGQIERLILDSDDDKGEIAVLGHSAHTIYSIAEDRNLSDDELRKIERLIPLRGNPWIRTVPRKSAEDPVGRDVSDIPKVLDEIRSDWEDVHSFNRQTASEILRDILLRVEGRRKSRRDDDGVDLLITGMETSLWAMEPSIAEMKRLFPDLRVAVVSGNKILLNDDIPRLAPDTVVLAVSQSGQTFSTLNAVIGLKRTLHEAQKSSGFEIRDRIYVMTGELDSLLGTVVGQTYAPSSDFGKHIFTNGSGWRGSEPSNLTVAAAFATMTEFLLYAAETLRTLDPNGTPLGMQISADDIAGLKRRRNESIIHAAQITGTDVHGNPAPSELNKNLTEQGKTWGSHILENAWSAGAAGLYVLLTVSVLQVHVVGEVMSAASRLGIPYAESLSAIAPLSNFLDSVVYIFFGLAFVFLVRAVQGRTLSARLGKRTLLIGDVPWVHQVLESYVSKMFSMSYKWASLDVHGGNPSDHFLHRYAHRIARGTLVLLGRPDGRQKYIERYESAVQKSAAQFKGVRDFGVGAEIISHGANPSFNFNAADKHIVLPAVNGDSGGTPRQDLQLFIENRFSSLERLISSFVMLWAMGRKVSAFPLLPYDMSRTKSGTNVATTQSPARFDDSVFEEILKELKRRYPPPGSPTPPSRSKSSLSEKLAKSEGAQASKKNRKKTDSGGDPGSSGAGGGSSKSEPSPRKPQSRSTGISGTLRRAIESVRSFFDSVPQELPPERFSIPHLAGRSSMVSSVGTESAPEMQFNVTVLDLRNMLLRKANGDIAVNPSMLAHVRGILEAFYALRAVQGTQTMSLGFVTDEGFENLAGVFGIPGDIIVTAAQEPQLLKQKLKDEFGSFGLEVFTAFPDDWNGDGAVVRELFRMDRDLVMTGAPALEFFRLLQEHSGNVMNWGVKWDEETATLTIPKRALDMDFTANLPETVVFSVQQ